MVLLLFRSIISSENLARVSPITSKDEHMCAWTPAVEGKMSCVSWHELQRHTVNLLEWIERLLLRSSRWLTSQTLSESDSETPPTIALISELRGPLYWQAVTQSTVSLSLSGLWDFRELISCEFFRILLSYAYLVSTTINYHLTLDNGQM